jgi:putative ABC transport system permease protein
MYKMFMLVRSYLHKSRGQMVSMFLIVFVAALLMNIGALILYDFGLFVDKKIEQLNAPHVAMIIEKSAYRPAHEKYLKSDLTVVQTSAEDILYFPGCSFAFGDGKENQNVVFQNAGTSRILAPLSIVIREENLAKNSVYAPYILYSGGGYELGDEFTLEYLNQKYIFRISGFVEDIMLGSVNTGVIGFYLPEPHYKRVATEIPAAPAVLLSAQLSDLRFCEEVSDGFNAFFSKDESILWSLPVILVKYARMVSANLVSMIIAAFALIIIAVVLIVIRFRISDSIRDDIKDIGALKALGYTSRQVKASILLQFFGITLGASVLGIALSYPLVPLISTMLAAQTGLPWDQGFAPKTSAVCLLIILLMVIFDVLNSSRSVKNLEPIIAIRGDIKARSYKKNYFRLDKAKVNLQLTLAAKLIRQRLSQNIMIAFIIAAVTFASAFGLVLFYNMAVNTDAFVTTIAGEICSLGVGAVSSSNALRLQEEIGNMQAVRKATIFDDTMMFVSDESCVVSITEDFDDLEGQMLYKGAYPKSPDEVAIGGYICKKYNKDIGDIISIRNGDNQTEYIVCGFIQSANNMGRTLALTTEGAKRVMPDYIPSFIYIYLHEGEDAAAFIRYLENRYGSIIDTPINLDELAKGVMGSYITIILIVAIIILMITAFIVSLILYFVIKTMINQRKRDFGVQKACGFTTFQLVQQISLSFLPVCAIGSIIGVIAGYLGINPMVSAMFKSLGIMKFDMVIAHLWLFLLCLGIVLLSYVVAVVISSRTRKISAFALVGG